VGRPELARTLSQCSGFSFGREAASASLSECARPGDSSGWIAPAEALIRVDCTSRCRCPLAAAAGAAPEVQLPRAPCDYLSPVALAAEGEGAAEVEHPPALACPLSRHQERLLNSRERSSVAPETAVGGAASA
jgi:hypothetical protein